MTVNSYDAMDGLPVIVDEFERFIKFVEEQKPKLSSKKSHLGKKDAFALNLLLQNKRAVRGPHYTQEQYPMIDLLYFLALDGELYVIGNDHKGSIVFTKTPRLEEYMELNIYEKYIFTFKVSLAHNKKSGGKFACPINTTLIACIRRFKKPLNSRMIIFTLFVLEAVHLKTGS